MKKLAVSLILSGIIGIAISSFSWHRPSIEVTASSHKKDLWPLATPTKIETLDPQQAVSAYEKTIITLLFSRLVNLDENVQVTGELAETWDYDMVSSTYSFHIRHDVFFSDGKQLRARDVIFSFHQWANPNSLDSDLLKDIAGMSDYRSGTSPKISGISSPDDFTVNIQMARWSESFIQVLAMNRFTVIPDGYNGLGMLAFFKKPIGSGPYLLESYSPESVVYTANPKYFRGHPATEKIHVQFLQESEAVEAFKKRKLYDLLMYDFASTGDLNDQDLVIHKSDNFSTMALYFVETDPRVADINVRKALLSSLNIDEIISKCFPDSTRANSLIPPGMIGSGPVLASDIKERINSPRPHAQIKILLPNDLNTQCFVNILRAQLDGTDFIIETVDSQQMYEIFKSGKMSSGVENLVFKTEDPISVLQYFRVSSNEYLLGKKIEPLERLFLKL
jgi:ABC-type oligopeptide transport system substrate-binding subunit